MPKKVQFVQFSVLCYTARIPRYHRIFSATGRFTGTGGEMRGKHTSPYIEMGVI